MAPKHAEGVVTVEISPDGIQFTNNKVNSNFTILDTIFNSVRIYLNVVDILNAFTRTLFL